MCILLVCDIAVKSRDIEDVEKAAKVKYNKKYLSWYMQAYEHGLQQGYEKGYNDRILYELENHVVLIAEPSSAQ